MRSSRSKKNRKKKLKRKILSFSLIAIFILLGSLGYFYSKLNPEENFLIGRNNKDNVVNNTNKDDSQNTKNSSNTSKDNTTSKDSINNDSENKENPNNSSEDNTLEEPKDVYTEVLISSAGDSTLGSDDSFWGNNTFPAVFEKNNKDYSYFFKNVLPIFSSDDITTVNLETTFTNSNNKRDKNHNIQFHFKGSPDYANILTAGSIEGVNLSNNHIYDYNVEGFNDTKKSLEAVGVNYFGENNKWITTVKGHKFGYLGYQGWYNSKELQDNLIKDIKELKDQNCTVIINFHWGQERKDYPDETQKQIAHFAIDHGADLIIGHHPHVIEGIEQYKGKLIAYSLANFCFGGNTNPSIKDTFILQNKFKFKNDELTSVGIKVIPCSISSVNYVNDYRPTPLTGEDKLRVLNHINKLSPNAGFEIKDDFVYIDVTNN